MLTTKAATPVIDHITKTVFWSGIAPGHFGNKILARMNDARFRKIALMRLAVMGVSYLIRAGVML